MLRNKIHIVGSIPLRSAEEVFDLVGTCFGEQCIRIPDGETGERRNWIGWQFEVFANQAALVQCPEKERGYQLNPPFTFVEGKSCMDLNFDDLGFAREAISSYALFEKKQQTGILSKSVKFLVAVPTPFAPVYSFISYKFQDDVFPAYESAILREIDLICDRIPPSKLAIQWDVATEMSIFEKVYTATFEDEWNVLMGRLVKLGNHVPAAVEMGFHLCYGSMNNRHWKEPDDLGMCVKVANALADALSRQNNFIHMPVPANRADDAYFHPLLEFRQANHTELYLGLVHDLDTLAGNRARMKTAAKYIEKFGIAAECGLGRREPATIPELLGLHAKLAADI